jgi:hypothetical protein
LAVFLISATHLFNLFNSTLLDNNMGGGDLVSQQQQPRSPSFLSILRAMTTDWQISENSIINTPLSTRHLY